MADLETRMERATAPTWRVRRATLDLGEGRVLTACSDGSWLLSDNAREDVASGQTRPGLAKAQRAAMAEAREFGWLR